MMTAKYQTSSSKFRIDGLKCDPIMNSVRCWWVAWLTQQILGSSPLSSQTKDYKTTICCFSAEHAPLRRKSNDWLAMNGIMCPRGSTCLSEDCCFSELALKKSPTNLVGLLQSDLIIINSLKINLFSTWYSWVDVKHQSSHQLTSTTYIHQKTNDMTTKKCNITQVVNKTRK